MFLRNKEKIKIKELKFKKKTVLTISAFNHRNTGVMPNKEIKMAHKRQNKL